MKSIFYARQFRHIFRAFLFVAAFSAVAYPFSDQTTSERILRENKYFIDFINTSVTNLDESLLEQFRRVYLEHFNADVSYLQADYKRTYHRVYASQKYMTDLYETILKKYYLESSKDILDKLAPDIIRSKNARARLYLTLGYRDRTVSWSHFIVGTSSNPKLFSYKLYKYEEAIKMARRAKRYGFLALFESQNAEMKRKIYVHLLKKEKAEGNQFFNRFVDLTEDGMIKELGRTYEEFEIEEKSHGAQGKPEDMSYEKKVEKRVRFRNETRMARFLLNAEFDQAEDIMRKAVSDFNFKLISSTFEVLAGGKEKDKDKDKDKDKKEDALEGKLQYLDLKVHLMDNYQRLVRGSMLDKLLKEVKVEDDIDKK